MGVVAWHLAHREGIQSICALSLTARITVGELSDGVSGMLEVAPGGSGGDRGDSALAVGVSGPGPKYSGPPPRSYSPDCVEGAFAELRLDFRLNCGTRKPPSPGPNVRRSRREVRGRSRASL